MATTVVEHVPNLSLDPFAPAFFDDPYPGHAAVRETAPVVRLARYDCFATGRYDEVRTMLTDWESYVSSRGVGLADYRTHPPYRGPSLVLETDPPLHGQRRAVLNQVLSPAAVRALRPRFTAAAEALAGRLAAGGTCDGITDIAEAYPLAVFPDALGMTREGRKNLLPYGNFVFNSMGPRNALLEASLAELPPLNDWVTRQSERAALTPDGFGAAIHAAADRGEITPAEAPLLVRSLLSAGIDTTVNGIGAALFCLARHPDEWDRLRADPGLARGAFEEAVRYESPVQTFFRTTARAVVLGGTPIPEGRKVLMFLAAANRDPRRWDDPDRYDITRNASGHVGFGAGSPMCVGQVLARLEGEVMLAALARHVARLELTGPPRRRHNNTLRGLHALPLRLHPAR
ncbi:MAG: cytochrome P450 [Acetobacteraceae bacterium]